MNRQRLSDALDQGASVNASLNAHICYRGARRIDGRYALVAVEAWTLGTALKLRFSVCLNEGGAHHELLHTVENYSTEAGLPVDSAASAAGSGSGQDGDVCRGGAPPFASDSARAVALELVPRLAFRSDRADAGAGSERDRADKLRAAGTRTDGTVSACASLLPVDLNLVLLPES